VLEGGPVVRIYPIRVYADTSVFGGAFDDEFRETSRAFFAQAGEGRFGLVTSVVVRQELAPAPENVRAFFDVVTEGLAVVDLSVEAIELQRAYLAHGVVGTKRGPDALHIALATCAACPLVVSWNFRHHVHVDKIRMYCAANALMGYSAIDIRTPGEVVRHEEEL
jgi:predicted nucleic acid-binding protein